MVFIVQKNPKKGKRLHFGTILLNLDFITVTRFGAYVTRGNETPLVIQAYVTTVL